MNQQLKQILQRARENCRYESGVDTVGFIYLSQLEEILNDAGASWMQGEGERLREAAESLLNALSKEHNDGKPIQRSIHVSLKIKALKEVLAPKPQTEHE